MHRRLNSKVDCCSIISCTLYIFPSILFVFYTFPFFFFFSPSAHPLAPPARCFSCWPYCAARMPAQSVALHGHCLHSLTWVSTVLSHHIISNTIIIYLCLLFCCSPHLHSLRAVLRFDAALQFPHIHVPQLRRLRRCLRLQDKEAEAGIEDNAQLEQKTKWFRLLSVIWRRSLVLLSLLS